MTPKTKVYALIIGINDYPASPLYGCVPDSNRIKAYLESDPRFDLQDSLLVLQDKAATKSAIVEGILNHLGRAGEGEVAFLYFSGHGAQERADPRLWPDELDGCLETIACYHPNGTPSLLADKELRYLLHQVAHGTPASPKAAPPHILTVFDCCHSGDNTRSVLLQEEKTLERRFTNVFPQRPWKDFLFADTVDVSALAEGQAVELLPHAPHVQLAAAKDDQAALEKGGEGVFTKYLIQSLEQSGGALDYASLHRILSNYIRFKYPQNPQINILGGSSDLLYHGFLGQEVAFDGTFYGRANYSDTRGWLLDMGMMQGLKDGDPVALHTTDGKTIEGTVNEAMDVSSTLDIDFELRRELDKTKAYRVSAPAFHHFPVHVFFRDKEGLPELLQLWAARLQEVPEAIEIVDKEAEADYTVHLRDGLVYITETFDPYRPVFQPQEVEEAEKAKERAALIAQLQQAAQWAFTYHLYNAKVHALKQPPIGIEVYEEGEGQQLSPVALTDSAYHVRQVRWNQRYSKHQARIKVKLTNNFTQPLHFCLLNLSEERESQLSVDQGHRAGLVEQPISKLQPGQSTWVFGHRGGLIPYSIGPSTIFKNQPYSRSWFKLIISTEPEIAYAQLIVPRSRMLDLPAEEVKDWTTQLAEIRIDNPRYNTTTEAELSGYLSDTLKAPLAAGLYLDADGLSPKPVLQPQISLLTEQEGITRSKSLFWDTLLGAANKWARYQRMRDFRRRVKRHYQRPLMISEGDSWFQHPTVMEIIDHLSLYYNIYSTGAAGDEMRNYLMTGEYLEAFVDVKQEIESLAKELGQEVRAPEYFLLSGGGNDILGDQFKDFLKAYAEVEELPESEKPERFLNQRFEDEMQAIMDLYQHVFTRMQTEQPEVAVIVHGYDYVHPLGVEDTGMSWLGKPMTLRGILRPGDRKGITDYLIDEFNRRLQSVAEPFEQVTHVDLRGAVKPYQWSDEIHPDDEGYQNIALRFTQAIDHLIQQKR